MNEATGTLVGSSAPHDSEAYGKLLLERLMADDPQFRAASPDPAISEARSAPGLTLAQTMAAAMEGYADRPCLGQRATQLGKDPATGRSIRIRTKTFDVLTYAELLHRIRALASFWHGSDRRPLRANDKLITLGFGSIDYVTILLAGIHNGGVLVPVQAGGVTAQLQTILNEIEPAWFATSCEQLDAAVELVLGGYRPAGLLLFDYDDGVDDDRERRARAQQRLAEAGLEDLLVTIGDALARGEDMPAAPVFSEPGSDRRLCTIYYTSGSTGAPKGAMLPENVIKVPVLSTMPFAGIVVHYMPMNHSFGPSTLYRVLASGGTAYLTKSDLSELLDDIRLARPTTMSLIPRLCEMLYSQFQLELSRRSSSDADQAGLRQRLLEEWRRDRLGGRLIRISFASAPLTPILKNFIIELVGVPLDEAFGSTEVSGVLFNSKVTRPPVIAYKLADVPALGYYNTDKPHPRGELLVKTETIMLGYYNQPQLTADAFDEEGYYRTGDVMEEIGPDHMIYVDRRNNVLKLAQAEFVAVQRLEGIFSGGSPLIAQTFIYGTSTRSFLLAVIVPDTRMVREMGLEGDEDALRAALRDAIQSIAQEHELQSYEVPRDFIVEHQPFSVENRLLTASAKFARPNLTAAYAPRLEAMYDEIAERQTAELERLRASGHDASVLETVLGAAKATLGLEDIDPHHESGFAELGGDSLASLSFSLLLGEIFGVEVPVGVITNPSSSLHDLARYIERARASSHSQPTFASVHGARTTIEASDLTLEKFLGADIFDHASSAAPQAAEVRTVLVTGSTGFLGRFLCLEWLERMAKVDGKVIAVVRGRDDADAARRLYDTYDTGDAELKQHFADLAAKHLEVVNGDLAEYRLGLSQEDWERYAATVDLIVHPAAFVNHILPYNQLFGPNVVGTAELIRLAVSVKRKRISNVSSMAVAILPGASFLDEDDDVRTARPQLDTTAEGYAVGYAISKWAAEVLLLEAHDRLGLQMSNYRCDMILAHSRYVGQLNIPDLFTRLLLSIAETGLAPGSFYSPSAERPHYDGLPVDFIARAMAELDLAFDGGAPTFHVVNAHDDGISLDTFVDWMIEAGLPITRIPDYQDWLVRFTAVLKTLPEQKRQQTSLPLMHQLQKPAPGEPGGMLSADRFSVAVRDKGVDEGGIPHLDAALIKKYVDDLRATGLLTTKHSSHH